MENFIVSARKYRPDKFNSVVGQAHITNTLKNAIKTGQLAQAFLFCGPRGVGKTTCARVLAKTINCQSPTADFEACGECESCLSFKHGNSMNIHELDAASNNSVEDIRSLVEQVRYAPQAGKYKIYIIDEVHMLSTSAFNAFLKTLEEPPSYAIFILATTEKHKILPTILSRCQIFDFNRIKVDDIAHHLEYIAKTENIGFEPDALHIIAQKADGALRDACSMFDQITSFSQGNITYKSAIDNLNILDYDYYFRVTEALLNEDISKSLLIFDEILDKGFDGNNFINGLCSHFRDLLVCKDTATIKLLEVSEGIKQKYLEQSQKAPVSFLLSGLNIGNQADLNYKGSKNQRLQIELSLMKMCHIRAALNLSNGQLPQSEVKKKPDTVASSPAQPVSAPSIPTPTVAKTETVAVPKTEPQKIALPVVKATVTASIPSLKIPSIKNLSGNSAPAEDDVKVETSIPETVEIKVNQPFTEEQLLRYWNDFAEIAAQDSKIGLQTVMTVNAPKLRPDYTIEVIVIDKYQTDIIQSEQINMLRFLKNKLQNNTIKIETVIGEGAEHAKKTLYTSTDKFKYLAEKNPNLIELRRRLDLEIDF
ncbi:DNA polymerase III subunit gamma/tau [Solitalea sp. MAHUQ-68]|uniref:DNA polymerase III subunit gamma/tau n=1 Tax=Solitalea agri TaxID=2953739 RepID=A0A9X2EZG4_9SPHI|nr:DNA polymerase III subunit gamma/tau [Solitalea agri]MCO4291792.1 DNA polymerase III subunit gamma/tau [Solitalea agri]